jgi:hypothetical protein
MRQSNLVTYKNLYAYFISVHQKGGNEVSIQYLRKSKTYIVTKLVNWTEASVSYHDNAFEAKKIFRALVA